MQKVLITALDSFTGKHLQKFLINKGYSVYGTSLSHTSTNMYKCDITSKQQCIDLLKQIKPDYIIHLSAISFTAHNNNEEFYKVNTIGTINLLDAIMQTDTNPTKIILASSATVYGNQGIPVLHENLCPQPANHYGASKYAMECMAKNYFDKLNIIITRPFNYTGIGQAEHFLIPKIVKHFQEKQKIIQLGNLDVSREFNDINFVCEIYEKLLKTTHKSTVVNIASEQPVKLLDVIGTMNKIANYKIKVEVNPAFVRKDEINTLCGSKQKLKDIIGDIPMCNLENLLTKMYKFHN